MPNYDYTCRQCDVVFEQHVSIANRQVPTTEPCPYCEAEGFVELAPAAPAIGDSMRLGRTKLPTTWTDTLKRIKSKHLRSTVNTDR